MQKIGAVTTGVSTKATARDMVIVVGQQCYHAHMDKEVRIRSSFVQLFITYVFRVPSWGSSNNVLHSFE